MRFRRFKAFPEDEGPKVLKPFHVYSYAVVLGAGVCIHEGVGRGSCARG